MTDLNQALQKVDDATNTLAANQGVLSAALDAASTRIAALITTLSTSMTAAQVEAAKAVLDTETNRIDGVAAALTASATVLNGLAAAPADPVPVDPVPVDPGLPADPAPPVVN
jgi:thioredoxin-like negative regulator of GroEL